jgi:hypothetical protein
MEAFIPLLWLISLKRNNNQYKADKIFEECSKGCNTGGKINGNIYIYCSASAHHGFGWFGF